MNATSNQSSVSIISEDFQVSHATSNQKVRPSEGILFNLSSLDTEATKEY